MVEPDRPQITVWHMCCTCWSAKTTNTVRICNTYCFSTATLGTRKHLKVTLYLHCLSCEHCCNQGARR